MPSHRGSADEHKLIPRGTSSGDTSQMFKRDQNRNDRKTRQDKAEEARLLGGTYKYVAQFMGRRSVPDDLDLLTRSFSWH